MSTDPKTVIEHFVTALQDGDMVAVHDAFAEDATWTLDGNLPLSGTWRGREAILTDFYGSIPRLYQPDTIDLTVTGLFAGGDKVAMEWTSRARTTQGEDYENRCAGDLHRPRRPDRRPSTSTWTRSTPRLSSRRASPARGERERLGGDQPLERAEHRPQRLQPQRARAVDRLAPAPRRRARRRRRPRLAPSARTATRTVPGSSQAANASASVQRAGSRAPASRCARTGRDTSTCSPSSSTVNG